MIIIAGKFKGRKIPEIRNAKYRPVTSKIKEAVFSILTSRDSIINSTILDLFAGTCSFAFEGLSRGAEFATCVDTEQEYLKSAKDFATKIGIDESMSFLRMSAINLPPSIKRYNLIFIDPPYNKNVISNVLVSLNEKSWLENFATLIVKMDSKCNPDIPDKFITLDTKVYSNTKIILLKYEN